MKKENDEDLQKKAKEYEAMENYIKKYKNTRMLLKLMQFFVGIIFGIMTIELLGAVPLSLLLFNTPYGISIILCIIAMCYFLTKGF